MIDVMTQNTENRSDSIFFRSNPVAWVVCALVLGVASITVPVPMLLTGIGVFALFVLTLRDLSSGVLAILGSIPIQSAAAVEFGSTAVTWTKLAVATTVAAWLVRLLVGLSRPRVSGIAIAFGCYVLVLVISIVEARDVAAWAGEVYRWTAALLVYVIATEAFRDAHRLRATLLVVAGGVLVMAVAGFWQVIVGAGPRTFAVDGVTRAYGTFGEPNPFAGYLEMTVLLLVPSALGRIFGEQRARRDDAIGRGALVLIVIASIAGTATLLATQSRGGYLGFAAGLALAVWLTGGRVRLLGTVGAGVCVLLVLASPIRGRLTERLRMDSIAATGGQVTSSNFAAQERTAHWRAALRMAESSPLLGVGAGNFNERFRESTRVWRFRIPRGHAHNAYLQALAQAGLLGLVSYLTLLVVVVRRIRRSLRDAVAGSQRSLVVGVAAVTLSLIVHNSVDYLHVLSLGLQLSIVWALLEVRLRHGERSVIRQPAASVIGG